MAYGINDWLSPVANRFGNIILDNEINGFKTIKVNGRETISNGLMSEQVSLREQSP